MAWRSSYKLPDSQQTNGRSQLACNCNDINAKQVIRIAMFSIFMILAKLSPNRNLKQVSFILTAAMYANFQQAMHMLIQLINASAA